MGKYSGFGIGWDKNDTTDIRACLKCRRPMRHRMSDAALFPGTVPHRANGHCSGCAPKVPARPRTKSAEEQARVMAAAMEVQRVIRVRRERLGIGPDGRKVRA